MKREPKAAPPVSPSSVAKTEAAASKPAAGEGASSTYNLAGHVELIVGAGQSVEADEVTDAVVYFVPSDGAPHPKPGHFLISTHGKKFDPPTIAVPVGSTVSFPNHDEILHNVFSVTPGSSFDLGVYGENGSADYTFRKAGLSVINCNVHQAMQANVLVLDTPYFTRPDKAGNFILPGVPSGPGKLVLWHVRATSQTRAMLAASTEPVALQLTLTKPRVTQHLNKESKPYQPARS